MGIYVTYTGLIKRETTKAVGALVSFLTIFILSTSFIAYSTDYISRINEFSADISNATLNVGTKMTMPNTEAGQKSSVDAIRDSLFEIQVKKPWMILQFGDSNLDSVGVERVVALESTSPFINKGKDRIEIIKEEINNKDNENLTITKTINRLGVVVFIFFFNILISIFVFILTGIMIFSQLLFIIFAVFLPVSFLLSMIPSFNHLMKSAVIRLFNVIMMRAGITLVLTISFSLSAMVYSLTTTQPFFVVAFMQIVVFAGIYFKLNDLMGMMSLNSSDSQNIGGRVMRRPKQTVSRTIRKIAIGRLAMKTLGNNRKDNPKKKENERQKKTTNDKSSSKNRNTNKPTSNRTTDKNQSEKSKQDARKNKTKNQYTKEDSFKEKDKIDAARKFKQSKYKGRRSEKLPDDKEERSKNNSNLKRRKAPTRTLEKPRKNPKNERVKLLGSDNSFDKRNLPLENKDRKIKNKISPNPLTSNTKKSRDFSKQPRELGGHALKRKTTLIQERKKETNKGTSTKKTNNLNGKGSTRK